MQAEIIILKKEENKKHERYSTYLKKIAKENNYSDPYTDSTDTRYPEMMKALDDSGLEYDIKTYSEMINEGWSVADPSFDKGMSSYQPRAESLDPSLVADLKEQFYENGEQMRKLPMAFADLNAKLLRHPLGNHRAMAHQEAIDAGLSCDHDHFIIVYPHHWNETLCSQKDFEKLASNVAGISNKKTNDHTKQEGQSDIAKWLKNEGTLRGKLDDDLWCNEWLSKHKKTDCAGNNNKSYRTRIIKEARGESNNHVDKLNLQRPMPYRAKIWAEYWPNDVWDEAKNSGNTETELWQTVTNKLSTNTGPQPLWTKAQQCRDYNHTTRMETHIMISVGKHTDSDIIHKAKKTALKYLTDHNVNPWNKKCNLNKYTKVLIVNCTDNEALENEAYEWIPSREEFIEIEKP